MTKTWTGLKEENRRHIGREVYSTLSGFKDEADVKEFVEQYEANWFVYSPRFTNIRQEDGTWKVDRREADSCD